MERRKVIGVKYNDVTLMAEFIHLGPSMGWRVYIAGTTFIFHPTDSGWEPIFNKLPAWLTVTELNMLQELFEKAIDEKK